MVDHARLPLGPRRLAVRAGACGAARREADGAVAVGSQPAYVPPFPEGGGQGRVPCFVTMCRVGVTVLSGAAGEIANRARRRRLLRAGTTASVVVTGASFDGDQVPPVARVLQRMIS